MKDNDYKRLAPWASSTGNNIYEGDTIIHPSGKEGVVVYTPGEFLEANSWKVRYKDGTLSILRLQVGDAGMGIVKAAIDIYND